MGQHRGTLLLLLRLPPDVDVAPARWPVDVMIHRMAIAIYIVDDTVQRRDGSYTASTNLAQEPCRD